MGECMKVEIIDKSSFSIFINRNYLKSIDFSVKEEVVAVVKDIIMKLRKRLNLHGFYKIKVFVHDKVGLFLDVVQLEDLDFSNALDLRVLVYFNEDIFFETENYFVIQDFSDIRYKDNKFYCSIPKDCEVKKLYEISEFGRFLYGEEVLSLLKNASFL